MHGYRPHLEHLYTHPVPKLLGVALAALARRDYEVPVHYRVVRGYLILKYRYRFAALAVLSGVAVSSSKGN